MIDVFRGLILAAFLLLAGFVTGVITPAKAAECGVKGSIQQMREAVDKFVAQGGVATVIEMNDDLIKAVTDKIGNPPQADIKKWYLLTAGDMAAIAITDSDDCIRTSIGPLPKQAIYGILGMSEASGG